MQSNSHCARINYCAFLRFNRVLGSISIEYLDAFRPSIWTRLCVADASKRLICDAKFCFVAMLYELSRQFLLARISRREILSVGI